MLLQMPERTEPNDLKHMHRMMAWCRAKGELNSMLHTFWGGESEKWEALNNKIEAFFEDIEGNGLHE
jgi:hypothetical protein